MEPDAAPARQRDIEIGLHNLLGGPGPEILRAEEDAMWNTMRTLPGGRGVQAFVYRISRLIELRPWARLHLVDVDARIADAVLRCAYTICVAVPN